MIYLVHYIVNMMCHQIPLGTQMWAPKCNNGKRKELRHALYFVTFEEVEECVEVPGWD